MDHCHHNALCVPPLDKGASWQEATWIPFISRSARLLIHTGEELTNCGHGEAQGIALAEEMLPTTLPALLLTDSLILLKDYFIL